MKQAQWEEDVSILMGQLCAVFCIVLAVAWYLMGPTAVATISFGMLLLLALAFVSPMGPTVRFDAGVLRDHV